jgi:hypothetical protein
MYHVHETFEEDQVQFQVTKLLRCTQSVYQSSSLSVKPSSGRLSRGSVHYRRGLKGVSFQREHIDLALEATIGQFSIKK